MGRRPFTIDVNCVTRRCAHPSTGYKNFFSTFYYAVGGKCNLHKNNLKLSEK